MRERTKQMSDLDMYLRWISRVRILCTAGLLSSLTVGIMAIAGNFEVVLGVILGVASLVVLVVSIVGLFKMSNRVFELEESFHRNSFETATAIIESAHEAKTAETTEER